MRRRLDEHEQGVIADAVAEQIKRSNWEVRQKPSSLFE